MVKMCIFACRRGGEHIYIERERASERASMFSSCYRPARLPIKLFELGYNTLVCSVYTDIDNVLDIETEIDTYTASKPAIPSPVMSTPKRRILAVPNPEALLHRTFIIRGGGV